ncbi:hypothetical protein FOZ63_028130 [Perkinsus olseni]|uniref:Uncharacterized protein n=1 Tax=Perkinsus olseni TaxID=32597 RepID=A0A7J6N5V4_PEROL|nr:hypothetical protein FOZ62_028938 [Perkinsus olseni]KAF4739339.1 hypothetical protein FOZ63_028130 [Perkinsus olseni]
MVKPVATWLITATMALVNTSAQFMGDYLLFTRSHKVRVRVSYDCMDIEFAALEALAVDDSYRSYWGLGHALTLIGGPDTYTVDGLYLEDLIDSIPSDYEIPPFEFQDGDFAELTQYNTISFKTRLEGKEVTFFRSALDLIPGSYAFHGWNGFRLEMEITTKDVMITFFCIDDAGELVGVQHELRKSDLIVGEFDQCCVRRRWRLQKVHRRSGGDLSKH